MTDPSGDFLWGIHAGRTGDAHTLFVDQGVIGLGWNELSDLSDLPPTRDEFKERFESVFSDTKAGAIPVQAGQLYRFVHEVHVGDWS